MLILFTAALFGSALLLFSVQPLFARMVLPLLGGAPAVWTTCMLFFQASLLAGYAYADASLKYLSLRRQIVAHTALLLLPLAVLPFRNPGVAEAAATHPVFWLLLLMLQSIGLPFFVLSSTAPVLQRWFSLTGHRAAGDPYFLYAASNIGSLAALLLYPVIIEPWLTLRVQQTAWAMGYVLVAALVCAAGTAVFRVKGNSPAPRAPRAERLRPGRRFRWVALSFVPSGLMLAVTSHITADIAAVPFLWVFPLAVYLGTFIVAFARPDARLASVRKALPLLILPLVLMLVAHAGGKLWFVLPLHVATFALAALLCHTELAHDRPIPAHLTEYYLWIAFGGMLGGVFNSIVAPRLFVNVAEYPILIAAACFTLASRRDITAALRSGRTFARPVAAGLLTAGALTLGRVLELPATGILPLLALPALVCFSVSRQPALFALGVTLILVPAWVIPTSAWGDVLESRRSFFGVYRVTRDRAGRFVSLYHGTTLHGRQTIGGRPPEPLTYFHRKSPIADVFAAGKPHGARRIAVIGLGIGSLAAYARPADRWDFYEIDPLIHRIAKDERFFSFLSACGERCRVTLGDGRLSLAAVPDRYDVLVVDAFSSDAIPVHLLTREAIGSYVAHLSGEGVIAFNISNRHVDLAPVLAGVAADQHMRAVLRADSVPEDNPAGYSSSVWVAMARGAEVLQFRDPQWRAIAAGSSAVWTDDFSNLWSVLHWR